jgi:hypothetical protein
MFIHLRRTRDVSVRLTLPAVALAATVLIVAVAATVMSGVLALGALIARAVLPTSWRHHRVPPFTPWPYETIDGTVVNATGSSDDCDLLRRDSDKG